MAAINFIREHRAFMQLAARENLEPAARALWTAIFYEMNDRQSDGQWPDGFVPIRNEALMLNASLSAATLRRARQRLQELGLIACEAEKGNGHTPRYQLLYLSARSESSTSQRQSQNQNDADFDADSAEKPSAANVLPMPLKEKEKEKCEPLVFGGGGYSQAKPAAEDTTVYAQAVRIGFSPSPETAARIGRLAIQYSPGMVTQGLQRCADGQAISFNYLEAVLRGAQRDGGFGKSKPPSRAAPPGRINQALVYDQRSYAEEINRHDMPEWLKQSLERDQHGDDTDPGVSAGGAQAASA